MLVLAVALTLGVTAGAAAAYQPSPGGLFNNPYGDKPARTRILQHIITAINHTPKGATIRIAVYSFDRKDVGDALVSAYNRGVNVQMVQNDNAISDQTVRLQSTLGNNPDQPSFFVICHGSCRGGYGNQHMKIYLFTHTGQARNVVMTGSSNLTSYAAKVQWNDMFTVDGVPAVLSLYTSIFNQLKYDKAVAHPFVHKTTGSYDSMFYPHPNTTKANDPLLRRLNLVRCQTSGGYGSQGHSKVRIAVYGWQGDRGLWLADRVVQMHKHGCDVKAIISNGGGAVAKDLKDGGVPVRSADYDYDKDGTLEKYTHEKWMTLSGTFDGNLTRTVWTGSENWSTLAPHNDEVTLRVNRDRAYSQYYKNFNFIWANHTHDITKHYGTTTTIATDK
ncbi:MAG: phospholipase D-like domain-containing protein [Nocardioidaceae bacterium]